MFCRKCGAQITENDLKCHSCGMVNSTEVCGGFWGLVGEAPLKKEYSPKKEPKPAEKLCQDPFWIRAVSILLSILCAAVVFSAVMEIRNAAGLRSIADRLEKLEICEDSGTEETAGSAASD